MNSVTVETFVEKGIENLERVKTSTSSSQTAGNAAYMKPG